MPDVTAWTTTRIPPTERTGRGRQVDGIMPAGGLTETTRQTTSADNPSSDAISFCSPIKWRLTVCIRYGYPKPTHQCGASGGRGGHARPAEGSRAEPAIAFGELVQPCVHHYLKLDLARARKTHTRSAAHVRPATRCEWQTKFSLDVRFQL